MAATDSWKKLLTEGQVIPACPLALTPQRNFDERRQRALIRYYRAAGAGGVAVAVHTTQFAIRDREVGLFRPLLELAAATAREQTPGRRSTPGRPFILITGVCGLTAQAIEEAGTACALGYHAGLLNLSALANASNDELIAHCRVVAQVIPLVGFYLQTAAGGRRLDYCFWRRFAEIPNVVAIKIAPFNRYQTLDVIRAIAETGRDDIALYTGNDDNILLDLLTPFRFRAGGKLVERRIVGGLLGHWAVWTKRAVELHAQCRQLSRAKAAIPQSLLRQAGEVTDANAAFFDVAHQFAGCIPGLHEVLRRQGLLAGVTCLDPGERLSLGQREEIDRVHRAYPHLNDDAFIEKHRDQWLHE